MDFGDVVLVVFVGGGVEELEIGTVLEDLGLFFFGDLDLELLLYKGVLGFDLFDGRALGFLGLGEVFGTGESSGFQDVDLILCQFINSLIQVPEALFHNSHLVVTDSDALRQSQNH